MLTVQQENCSCSSFSDVTRPLPLGLLQLCPCRPSRLDTDATSARAERCRPASARSWPPVTYHGSPTRFTLAAGQAPHHIQDCITDASSCSPAVSNVSVRPRRVQLRRHSAATSFYYHQSCQRSTNQDSVQTAGLRCLWSRHLERSSPSYPPHRLLHCFPAFAKNTPISYCF